MPHPPNRLIEEAFLAPTVELIRRIEIYEQDGKTPWEPEAWKHILVGGSVNIDYSNDSRRSLDVELFNYKDKLTPGPEKFWYDKVIKAYVGIVTHKEDEAVSPKILIVEENSATNQALILKNLLHAAGCQFVDYDPLTENISEIQDYDIIVSISGTHSLKLELLTLAYQTGKSVLSFGLDSTSAQLPMIIGSTGPVQSDHDIRHFENDELDDPISTGWDEWNIIDPRPYRPIVSTPGKVVAVENANTFGYGSIMIQGQETGVWIHTQMADFDKFETNDDRDGFISYLASVVDRADTYDVEATWETQVGEFIPENISDSGDVITESINVTALDYSKRCKQSKFSKATMFTEDQRIVDVIRILAANAGIFKHKLPETLPTVLGKDTTWERDAERWAVMSDIATANNYDLWFDAEGFLRLTPQSDPLLTPSTLSLNTGPRGNLVSRGRKTSDASLFNHITVVGESSDKNLPLVFGEAVNDDPASPSSIQNIGDRVKNINNNLITSTQQAQEIADVMLSIAALEEFELDFTSLLLPWIEAGEVLEMKESDAGWAPARYLITSLSIPLDLSPMSGNGKRVTKL